MELIEMSSETLLRAIGWCEQNIPRLELEATQLQQQAKHYREQMAAYQAELARRAALPRDTAPAERAE